jgi:hypothetical protein
MIWKCQNKECQNKWSTLDGYICQKCGQEHKAEKELSKLREFITKEIKRLSKVIKI